MTAAITVRCDGTPAERPTISLERCRAAFPTQHSVAGLAVVEAQQHGWTSDGDRDFCPACSRHRC